MLRYTASTPSRVLLARVHKAARHRVTDGRGCHIDVVRAGSEAVAQSLAVRGPQGNPRLMSRVYIVMRWSSLVSTTNAHIREVEERLPTIVAIQPSTAH